MFKQGFAGTRSHMDSCASGLGFNFGKHFADRLGHRITISGLIPRMRHHARGLANIALLLTMLILTLSTTAALYSGIQEVVRVDARNNLLAEWYQLNGGLLFIGLVLSLVFFNRCLALHLFQTTGRRSG